jgi:RimJ/RimL family protein N-acetyltransferase
MTDSILTLRVANQDDCKDIWRWRNCPEARKRFFVDRPVSWPEHKKWLASKLADKRTGIYIAEKGARKAGVIRFDSQSGYLTVSVNLNPDFFGHGLGSRIIKKGTRKALSRFPNAKMIAAEIISGNIASVKAFKKAGYIFTKRTRKKNRKADVYEFRRARADVI